MTSRERPIIFSAAMVRAILSSSKTQTRRVVKPKRAPEGHWMVETRGERHELTHWDNDTAETSAIACPYGQPGDHLWVRESHWWFKDEHDPVIGYTPPPLTIDDVSYRADGDDSRKAWRPSIHMPRWASRITLEITGVRVERLQDISEADAIAEGGAEVLRGWWSHEGLEWNSPEPNHRFGKTAVDSYRLLWEQINGPGSWGANPWVWVVTVRQAAGPAGAAA